MQVTHSVQGAWSQPLNLDVKTRLFKLLLSKATCSATLWVSGAITYPSPLNDLAEQHPSILHNEVLTRLSPEDRANFAKVNRACRAVVVASNLPVRCCLNEGKNGAAGGVCLPLRLRLADFVGAVERLTAETAAELESERGKVRAAEHALGSERERHRRLEREAEARARAERVRERRGLY
jgi:hypothetical protein